jgi:hypothetical protein
VVTLWVWGQGTALCPHRRRYRRDLLGRNLGVFVPLTIAHNFQFSFSLSPKYPTDFRRNSSALSESTNTHPFEHDLHAYMPAVLLRSSPVSTTHTSKQASHRAYASLKKEMGQAQKLPCIMYFHVCSRSLLAGNFLCFSFCWSKLGITSKKNRD